MGFIPIFLQVEGKPCLVVGGGEVALRKIRSLVAAGAALTVVSPEIVPAIAELADAGALGLLRRAYRAGDMAGQELVYAATGDVELSRRLFEEARRLNILINVADTPDCCSFIVPSVIRRGQLQIAISTGGASPALSRTLRQRIEALLGDELEVLLEIMAAARDWLKHHEADGAVRARRLNALAESSLGDALRRGDWHTADKIVAQCLESEVSLADMGVAGSRLFERGSGNGEPAR
jgi:precorrin-2 dehydrogenase/sirohydrochlorin ferrochelatase